MSLLDIIFLAIALAMDCFEIVAIARMAFLFGFFQAAMPLLGWLGISHFQTMIEAYDHWIAFSLLLLIGGNMIREAFGPEEEQHFNPRKFRTQLILAIATSIDALAIGISFACTGYEHLSQLTLPLSIIGLVSFLFSILGNKLGTRFGKAIARRLKPELLGGVILILIGSPETRASRRCHSHLDWCEDSRFTPVRIVFCKKLVPDRRQKEKNDYLCNRKSVNVKY